MKTLKKTTTALILASTLYAATSVSAADTTLRFGHFWPAVSSVHEDIFEKWAQTVEQDSNGKIDVQVYPSSTIAKAPAQYDAVKNRILDITATVQGYTANKFPLTQIVELPGIVKNAQQGSCIIQNLYDEGKLASEYKDTRPLFLFTHGAGLLHTKEKVEKPEDLANLRIRRPTSVVANLLTKLKALPVGMPAPESYQSMQRGIISGVALPWEGVTTFKINELAEYHTDVGGLYSLSFIVTMNKDVYNALPEDMKKVIDKNSGMTWSLNAAKVFDELDQKGLNEAKEMGDTIITINDEQLNSQWQPVLDEVTKEYLDSLEAKGLPANEVYERAKELSQTSCNQYS